MDDLVKRTLACEAALPAKDWLRTDGAKGDRALSLKGGCIEPTMRTSVRRDGKRHGCCFPEETRSAS